MFVAAKDKAERSAREWLQSNRGEFGKDAWHHLPDSLRADVEKYGIGERIRMNYEDYDRTHDFLGRPIQEWQSDTNSMMHQFTSPWGR